MCITMCSIQLPLQLSSSGQPWQDDGRAGPAENRLIFCQVQVQVRSLIYEELEKYPGDVFPLVVEHACAHGRSQREDPSLITAVLITSIST